MSRKRRESHVSFRRNQGAPFGGSIAVLAGVLYREDFLSYRRRKIDQDKLILVEEVILTAFVDDSHKVVLGRSRIRHDPVDLSQN